MSKIILTTDRTLMSEYNGNEFLGFAACSPTLIPDWLYSKILCPPVPEKDGRATVANCGVRKLESALLNNGFAEEDVAVVRPQDLKNVLSEKTKVLGITTNDPLGLGPASTTFSELIGKESYSSCAFRELISNSLIKKYNIKVIVGGPGAWQLEDERIRAKLGLDTVFIGEGEITAPKLFEQALNGEDLPRFAHGEVVPLEQIPLIKNPTINGLVEIARGCGRGCKFCNPTMLHFRCQSIERIIKEVKINLQNHDGILLHAEDILRYKAKGVIPDEKEVLKLFREVKKLTNNVGISHFALASVLSKPKLIERLSEDLNLSQENWLSGQTGIETGSARIACKYLKGKALPFNAKNWPEVVIEAHKVLEDNHWVPCSTLIMGLPGGNEEDVIKTIELVEDLKEYKSLIVPLFFVPIGMLNKEKFFRTKDMLPEHWRLLATCIDHDFKWVYRIVDEHFRMTKFTFWKSEVIKVIVRILQIKLRTSLKIMKDGMNPINSA